MSRKPEFSETDQTPSSSTGSHRLIKKYPNRRLYDTQTSSYITLQEVKSMVIQNAPLKVVDAKTNEDLTRSIYLQIILDEESGGFPIFSEIALANIIRFYGHSMQDFMGTYLENNVQNFLDIQTNLAEQGQNLSPEIWTQMLTSTNPFLQNMMVNYSEQTQQLLTQMQAQMMSAMGLKR